MHGDIASITAINWCYCCVLCNCVLRDFIRSHIVEFAVQNPECEVTTLVKRNKHPFLRGVYCT